MLDKIISFSIHNKFLIGLLTIILVIWGLWSATKLPIDAVPDITNNQVQIITSCPTLAGQEVEQLVTYPIEQSISNLPDLIELRSISRFGLSVITVVFNDKVDIYFARQLINEKLMEASEKIPAGIGKPELAPVSTGLGEVYQYIIHPTKEAEQKYSAMDLRTMQDWIVARQLYGTAGIAEVNSFGGQLKQYEVSINPEKLLAMHITIPEIFSALEKNNENTGGAYIDKRPNAYFIRGVGLVNSFDDIRNIVVKLNPNGIPILIKNVADVQLGSAVRYGALTYNGEKDAVGGIIMMLKGANSAEVVNRIKEKLPVIQKSLPSDVIIEPFLDRTDLVNRAMSTVERNLLEGALIVIFVLVLFLGNLRAGLIVASAIPLSMLFALGLMNVFGVSANLMSLGAIDFGLIVDGAVIIVESIFHRISSHNSISNHKPTQAEMDNMVLSSASKMMNSASFGQIIILIVYLPILSLIGIEGKMFRPMAQTVSFAILGAFLLSLTYIPMMSSFFLSKNKSAKESFSDRLIKFFQGLYSPLLSISIKFKGVVVLCTIIVFLFSTFLFSKMGGEFIPTLQEGDFAFHCILPQGTSLSQSIETSMQASRLIKEFDEVKMVVGKTGSAEVPTDPMPPEATDLMIILKSPKEWKRGLSYDELAEEIEEKLNIIPGVFFEKNQPIQMRFNELMTGVRQDVAVKIFGENLDTLLSYANKVSGVIQKVKGTTEPMVERIEGLPQIVINYNRSQIANYGLNIEEINHIVSTAFAGGKAGVVFENERRFDLVVRSDSSHRSDIEDLDHLYIPLQNGTQIPLSQVAEIKYELGPAQISRESGKRRIVIGFNVKDRDVATVVKDIQQQLEDKVSLPEGYYFAYGGTFENLQNATKRLLIAVPVALALIFMLLFFTFHSIKQALLIFTAIPMSAIGGVFALLLRDMPFSISAGIGFIALFGVAVLNGIVLIGTFNELEKEGINDILERVKQGTRIRLRPVLMTATVASLGFLPMALSHGAGAEVQKPLATVVIGGLITATFLTLFVLPLLYIFFTGTIKIKLNTALFFVVAFSGFCNLINAQSSKSISLDSAISIALKNNLAIKAKEESIKSADKKRSSVFELPKTNFNFQYGQFNSINNDFGFSISQTIPFPSYFNAKSKLFNAELKRNELSHQISQYEIKAQVSSVYFTCLYLLECQKTFRKLDSLFLNFRTASALRYQTGETNLIEKTTAEAKNTIIKLQLKNNESELRQALNDLRTIMNVKDTLIIDIPEYLIPITLIEKVDSTLIRNNASSLLLYQEVLVANENLKLERALNLPDFSLSYLNQSIIGTQNINGLDVYFDKRKRFQGITFGLSVPLTYFNTSAKLNALKYQNLSLQYDADNGKQILNLKLNQTLEQYSQRLYEYQAYQGSILENAKALVNTSRVAYNAGEINYIEYIQALQNASDIQLNYLKLINELNQLVIQINYLLNK